MQEHQHKDEGGGDNRKQLTYFYQKRLTPYFVDSFYTVDL